MTSTRALLGATTALALLAALALTLPRPTAATATYRLYLPLLHCPDCTGTGPGVNMAERLAVVRMVNAARVAAGCPAAVVNDTLMAATQAWSVEMDRTNNYRHAGGQWYVDHGYPSGAAENIGTSGTAEQIFSAWMGSPAHKRNMLSCLEHDPSDPAYSPQTTYEIGVGFSGGDEGGYWTLGLGTVFPTEP